MGFKNKLKKAWDTSSAITTNFGKSSANIATAGQINSLGGTSKLAVNLADTGGLYQTYKAGNDAKTAVKDRDALYAANEETARAEQARTQAIVDEQFTNTLKKKSMMAGRSSAGKGLYTLGGGSAGLYSL